MKIFGKLGWDEGPKAGPEPGDGADLGGMVAGGSDFDGTAPDELPPRPGDARAEPDRWASGGVCRSRPLS